MYFCLTFWLFHHSEIIIIIYIWSQVFPNPALSAVCHKTTRPSCYKYLQINKSRFVLRNTLSALLWYSCLFYLCWCRLQLALGHGARRLHVSAAYRAKAKVSMSRFEPTSFVNYEKLQSNVDIVRKRSAIPPICSIFALAHTGFLRHSAYLLECLNSSVCLHFATVSVHICCFYCCQCTWWTVTQPFPSISLNLLLFSSVIAK